MSYLVLARKWRPLTFNDLVGQEHVAHTLKNAIAQGRIAHAFLFTGARGVGKTTIARVMAKALNCMSAKGPTPEPCAKCPACEEIARGNDVDVKEIDGASNNSVDDVRRLQESLPYMPARDRFKVVIIDEVHMLSTGAFNALLKTLEEPPPHVKFIFATTEVHKVPITILSRCQRYDFKLIPTAKIRERVRFILEQEGIRHDDAAVALVAREAAGSMRDALSLLDQVIAGATGEITGAEAARLLGVADRKVLYDLARAVLHGEGARALEIITTVAREGYDLASAAREFLAVLRDLVVCKTVADPGDLLDLADEERADVAQLAAGADGADLDRLFVAWSRTTDEVARAREPRWVLEMALVRLANRPPLLAADELLARLADLERRLGGGDTRGPSPGGGGGGGTSTRGPGATPAGGSAPGARRGPVAEANAAASPPPPPVRAANDTATPPRAEIDADARPRFAPSPAAPLATAAAPALSPVPGPAVAVSATVAAAPVTSPRPAASSSASPFGSAAQRTPAAPTWLARVQAQAQLADAPSPDVAGEPANQTAPAPASVPAPPRPAPADLLDTRGAAAMLDPWERVVDAIENGPVAILKHAVPLEVSGARVRFAYENGSFYARKCSGPEVPSVVAEAAAKVFGSTPEVEVVLGSLAEDAPTLARRDEAARAAARARREETARNHPLVRSVIEILGGEVRGVKLDET